MSPTRGELLAPLTEDGPHILGMSRVAVPPGLITQLVYLPGTVVALVEAERNKSLVLLGRFHLSLLPPFIPVCHGHAGNMVHAGHGGPARM